MSYTRIEARFHFLAKGDAGVFKRGQETASWDFNSDGTMAFRACSVSFAPPVARDVICTLTADFRPIDAFVRVQAEGTYKGSGWFEFRPDAIISSTFDASTGVSRRTTSQAGEVLALCAHPVTTDAFLARAYDRSGGARRQRAHHVLVTSPDPYGRTAPTLNETSLWIELVGGAPIETPVGSIECDQYRYFATETASEPVEELWVMKDTFILLRARAAGVYDTSYELTELRTS